MCTLRCLFLVALAASTAFAQSPLPLTVRRALNGITAANLKGDLSFLASDALQGRYTPSPGLDVAAEFIASQFRAAGLEPGGNNGYFQTADMVQIRPGKAQADLKVEAAGHSFNVPASSIVVTDQTQAANIQAAPVLIFNARDPNQLQRVDLTNKAVIVPAVNFRKLPEDQAMLVYTNMRAFDAAIASSHAAVEIVVTDSAPAPRPALLPAAEVAASRVPKLAISSEELKKWFNDPAAGNDRQRTISIALSAPDQQKALLKNVIAVLPGSDPVLKNTYVLLTAHYDHIGTSETAVGSANHQAQQNSNDHIFNGANDDGSGTVSVIEIARGLSRLAPHPRRSLVFMTFFGEELGDLGSHYYGEHPAFPISKTVADLNLEQVGRTDSTNGKQINTASLTGYDYSDVTGFLERAGRKTGVRVYLDKEASDPYFLRSDNAALAEKGVPAHSLTVAFDYPDYHGVGDEWPKIDYDNMARVDRMIALGLIDMANASTPPHWNAQNNKTAPFREAQQKVSRP